MMCPMYLLVLLLALFGTSTTNADGLHANTHITETEMAAIAQASKQQGESCTDTGDTYADVTCKTRDNGHGKGHNYAYICPQQTGASTACCAVDTLSRFSGGGFISRRSVHGMVVKSIAIRARHGDNRAGTTLKGHCILNMRMVYVGRTYLVSVTHP